MPYVLILISLLTALCRSNPIVIGIFTQSYIYPDHSSTSLTQTLTYIMPTYSNLIHMSGAQTVPIFSYQSEESILKTLEKVSGVVFTGGEEVIDIGNRWTQNAWFVLKYAQDQNKRGRVFTILAICQGLQLMLYLTSDHRPNFLDNITNQKGVFNTIDFVTDDYYLLKGISNDTKKALTHSNQTKQGGIAYYYHSYGILQQTFQNDLNLTNYWKLMATTTKQSQTFVSYLQSKSFPFYLTMFHPQRLVFSISNSKQMLQCRINLANTISLKFFMQSIKSIHVYQQAQLFKQSIDNYELVQSQRFYSSRVFLFYQHFSYKSFNQRNAQNTDYAMYPVAIAALIIVIGAGYKRYTRQKQQQARTNHNHINHANQMELNQEYQ